MFCCYTIIHTPFRNYICKIRTMLTNKTTPYGGSKSRVSNTLGFLLLFFFYASAFRHRRHYVFGLSVRPSVRSLDYPLSTCTWVRWSTRPTVSVLQHVRPLSARPSVRPERFPGICRRKHGGNGLKFYMLMYLDRL